MGYTEEIGLLIKSRFPLLYLETADEDYTISQLKEIASLHGLVYYQWSLTGGLRQERKDRCFIAATANDVMALPPELLRKGRLDEIFFVDLPDQEVRRELFKIHLTKRGLEPGAFDLFLLAGESTGFSGAEIEQAIIAALYSANRQQRDTGTGHILEQIRSTRPLSVLRREEITTLRQWAQERTIPA